MSQTITYNGITSSTYDLTVYEQEGAFSSPRRDIEVVHVPGRNGDVIIDKGCYLNQKVRYNVIANDVTKIHDIANWLLSASDYCELSDTWTNDLGTGNTEGFYRQAIYSGDIDMAVTELNRRGQTTLEFDCKPQKYYANTTAWPNVTIIGAGTQHIAMHAPQVSLPLFDLTLTVDAGAGGSTYRIQIQTSYDGVNFNNGVQFNLVANSSDVHDFDGTNLLIDCERNTVKLTGTSYLIQYISAQFPEMNDAGDTWIKITLGTADTGISGTIFPRWWTI